MERNTWESAHPTAGLPQTRLSRCSGRQHPLSSRRKRMLAAKGTRYSTKDWPWRGWGREAETREHVPCALFHPGEGDLRAWDSARVQECLPPV